MTSEPGAKRRNIRKPLFLSVATKGTATNWREPDDQSREFSHSLDPWVNFAKTAERGKFNSIFFIDHLSWFDVYGHSHDAAAINGVNAARIDPLTVISALARETKHLGFAATISTVSEHPYHLHRRLASIDHLTNGRVAWNIVASYLPSVGANLLNGEPLPEHDTRYAKTEEYLDVIYDLLLSSWSDDAVVYDKEKGIFADPERIRNIDHEGKFFKIQGPAITEPSKQRIPVLFQAGGSKKGRLFGAENAEVIFVGLSDPKGTRETVQSIKSTAQDHFKRDPKNVKFIGGLYVTVGKTHEEAVAKYERTKKYTNDKNILVYYGGSSNIDVAGIPYDEPIPIPEKINGVQGTINAESKAKDKKITPGSILNNMEQHRLRFVGSAEEIADTLEIIVDETGIDGLNFDLPTFPEGLDDIVDLLIPELQKRGLAQTEYPAEGTTFREVLYGIKGQSFFPEDHPAYDLRWRKGVSKEDFEKHQKAVKIQRKKNRIESLKF